MAAFNFDKFEAEFKQKRQLQTVAQLFGLLRNPQDPQQRLLAIDPGTPLHGFMEELRIGTDQPPPEFDFELGQPITIEQAGRMCRERRVNNQAAPVNLPPMLVTAGQRIFFNTAMAQPEVFVEISRPESSDLPSEIAACHFLDGAKTVIDWSESLPNLKALAQERIFTENMTRKALHRLVSRFTPEHAHLVSDMTANEMANYLLRTETNRDKAAFRRRELYELVRKPEAELRAPLTTARRLIDRIYPADNANLAMQRSSAWRMAIISFLPDELAIPISERLRVANEICQPITDAELEAMAYQSEEMYRKTPSFPLKFGRTIGSLPVSAMIQFNSMENGIASNNIPNHGFSVPGYGRLNQTYPLIPPMADYGQAVRQQEAARQAERAQQAAALEQAVVQQQQLAQQHQEEADFLNKQLITLQQQEQEAAADLLPRAHETPQKGPQTTARQQLEASVELHSINLHSPQNDRLNRLENQIELLALTIKEGRLTSEERKESTQTRNQSKETSQLSSSRGYSASRQQTERGRSASNSAQYQSRQQSKSPGRQNGSSAYAPDRRSRKDDHSADRRREQSFQARQTYPKMRKGENCSLEYDPLKQKSCSKCSRPGHHEFECYKYDRYSPKKCTVCDKLNHFAGDCKELEKFPPKGKETNSMEAGKNC